MARLYIVSTPIGNLADMSHRALEVLGSVTRVYAEDTRRTAILFRRYDLRTPLASAHEHNEAGRAEEIVAQLEAGSDVALVSDAGTPLLSDPGARIVQCVLEAGHEVVPVPGASALLAALVGAGLPAEPFTWLGFPPRQAGARRELAARVAALDHTAVLYEAPGRLGRLLEELAEACGAERPAAVARELTKLHETFQRGTLGELAAYYSGPPPRGEIVVVVGPPAAVAPDPAARRAEAEALARELLDAGSRPSDVARELARRLELRRNAAYEIVLAVTGREGG
ncbi:MAG: 16S rRNA (cytidine(1402)-2'-O)-methyltransferase [Gemmatimonadota bacterium]